MCEAKKGLETKEYKDALKKSTSARKIIDNLMKEKKLDAPLLYKYWSCELY
jgi:hypothetical protein